MNYWRFWSCIRPENFTTFFKNPRPRSRTWLKKQGQKNLSTKNCSIFEASMRHFQGEDIIIWWAVRSCSHPRSPAETTHRHKATMKDWKRLWMHTFIYVHAIIYIYRYVWFILITYFLYVLIMYNNTYSDVYTLYNTYVYMSHIIFENTSIHKLHNAYIYIYTHILVWLKVFPSIGWMIGMHPIFLASSSSHHGIFLSRKCTSMLGFSSTNVWYSHRTTPVWVEPGCQRAWLTAAMRWIWMMRICSFSLVFRDTCWFFGQYFETKIQWMGHRCSHWYHFCTI